MKVWQFQNIKIQFFYIIIAIRCSISIFLSKQVRTSSIRACLRSRSGRFDRQACHKNRLLSDFLVELKEVWKINPVFLKICKAGSKLNCNQWKEDSIQNLTWLNFVSSESGQAEDLQYWKIGAAWSEAPEKPLKCRIKSWTM